MECQRILLFREIETVPIYASESKPFPWKWLLAVLILAILIAALLFREQILGGRQSQSQVTEPDGRSKSAVASPSPKKDDPAVTSSITLPDPSGIPASDTWYTKVAFRGLVLNETNRAPVPGATVSVYAYASPPASVEKLTGGRGDFEVIAPPAYRYDVKAEAVGFRAYEENSFVITRPYYQMEILLTPVEMLRGRVVDNLNAGIPDAIVQLRREADASSILGSTTTDAKGAFTFARVPRSGRFNVEAFHSGFDATGPARVSIPAASDILIRMNPVRSTGSLAGTVTDTAQKPLPGAQIDLYEPSDGRLTASVQSDREGLYRFARVREGYYLVRCTAEGFSDTRTNQATVAVVANREARADFSIDPGLALRGLVVNQKEEPVPDAQVTYMQVPDLETTAGRSGPRGDMQRSRMRVTTTDKDGRFQISGLPNAQFQIGISHRDYQSLTTRLRPGNQIQMLILESGLFLRGTISDARGAAVERFTLTLRSSSGRSEKSYSFITTDGHFEIHGLSKDTYQVGLRGGGRGGFSGTLDLQGSSEINILLDNARGGRGQSLMNIIKSK